MAISKKVFHFICTLAMPSGWQVGYSQHVAPVAVNDSFSVVQPLNDTINITANDISFGGDGICIKTISGSSAFGVLNCNQIVYRSDSSNFGNDTAFYVICNDNAPTLCDTGQMMVTVQRHYTPLMLNNSRWTTYTQSSSCDNSDMYSYVYDYYWTEADTVINSKIYKSIGTREEGGVVYCLGNYIAYNHTEPHILGFLRQDTLGKKVILLLPDRTIDSVLYDFNIGLNDTLYANQYDTVETASYSYFKTNNNNYRQVIIENKWLYLGWFTYNSAWIEGIGSTCGPFTLNALSGSQLQCFSTNGTRIYPEYYENDTCAYVPVGINDVPDIQTSIHPNPTTGLCTLQLSEHKENVCASISDLLGREIFHLLHNQSGSTFNFDVSSISNGVYFIMVKDGKGHLGTMKLVKE